MSGSLPTTFFSKIDYAANGCWNWTAYRNGDRYGLFSLFRKYVSAHRVSWMLHRGPIPKGLCVLHKCVGNKACVNPEHLYLGTQKRNAADRMEQGRQTSRIGVNNTQAKLTENEALQIKALRKSVPQRVLAKHYGVSPKNISSIQTGRNWPHLFLAPLQPLKKILPERNRRLGLALESRE